jgi:integrase
LNPGSQAWRACVLNHSRCQANWDTCLTQSRRRPPPPKVEATIINTLIALRNDGLKPRTLTAIDYKLRELERNTDINNPDAVKSYISTGRNQTTKEPLSDASKNKFAFAYDKYCQKQGIQWSKPFFKVEEKAPLIPTTESVNAIINTASKRYTVIFTILAETGAEGNELSNVTQADIDAERGIISIRGCKGHASGQYKLKQRTAEMLRIYLQKNPQEHPFPRSEIIGQVWRDTRERASQKQCKPELNRIPLKSLRNYSGAQLYKSLPTRDPIAVMRHLRHKKLETTMHYIRAIVLDYEEDDQWISRTSTTLREDAKLTENGFQYVTERDGTKLFRKHK